MKLELEFVSATKKEKRIQLAALSNPRHCHANVIAELIGGS